VKPDTASDALLLQHAHIDTINHRQLSGEEPHTAVCS